MSNPIQVILDQPNITFTIIKSDAVKNGVADQIIGMILEAGFYIIHRFEAVSVKISMAQGVKFYYEHIGRNYFPDLMKSLIDGCIPLILEYPSEDESAITKLRRLIGATNSRNAASDTIRGKFGGHLFNPEAPVAENAIHGSDSLISVLMEMNVIFPDVTSINSLKYGNVPLSQFQVGEVKLPEKVKILQTDLDAFVEAFNKGDFKDLTFGKAFYEHFKLHESILKDNPDLVTLCKENQKEAIILINKLISFI